MRHGVRYEDALQTAPVETHGASGYFSKPEVGLDPHLFVGEQLHPNVRSSLLRLLYGFWGRYNVPRSWSTVWLAGSGVSHQWGADRGGIGDLDVLIGVDMQRFRAANPEFRGLPEPMIAARFNKEFHGELWPQTAEYDFGGRKYEVTFYVNSGAADIRSISPYAAYNVSADDWTVAPIELPEDWGPGKLPAHWHAKFTDDATMGRRLIDRYNRQAAAVELVAPGHPRRVNAMAGLRNTIEQANALFEEIHADRKNAFSAGGAGFVGFENARWQMGKASGIIDGLRQIRGAHGDALRAANMSQYGDATLGTEEGMVRAALWGTKYREGG